jgi:hypothetical protein
MGLLDDAIREHLELKRQHGGDPSEIERLEREALGAAGRATEPAGDEAAAPDAAPDPPEPAEPEPEPAAETPPPTEDHAIGAAPEAVAAAPGEESRTEIVPPAEPAPRAEADWMADDPPADAEPAVAPDEDVLEETPEFLQETPEHDRLWFEQKPPRDFDWDR